MTGPTVHRIDPQDRIVHLNRAWLEFARANDAPFLNEESVLGRTLWGFISDPSTRHVYEVLTHRVRESGGPVEFPFRCDAPDRRRHLSMRMTAEVDGSVEFESRIVREEARDPMEVLDFLANRGEARIRMCGWCKAVATPDGWSEIETAIRTLNLLESPALPRITHGICDACSERWRAEME